MRQSGLLTYLLDEMHLTHYSETWEVASFAKEYVQKNGPNDTVFQTYFGTKPQTYSAVLGVWDAILTSDKSGVIFRCDNIDGVSEPQKG